MSERAGGREPVTVMRGRSAVQLWPLPLEEGYLRAFLTDLFETYWDQIVYGPLIEGAAYELTCPCAPTAVSMNDGYFTVSFGGPHFHLCIGDSFGGDPNNPASEESRRRRKPSEAQIFRQLDRDGAPTAWGFEMKNGQGEPMMTVFFASPFISRADTIEDEPRWERLAMWRDISARYLGREPEAFDESGQGFRPRAA